MSYDPSGPGLFPDSYIEEPTRSCDSGEESVRYERGNPFRRYEGLVHATGRECRRRNETPGPTVGSGVEAWVTCPECKEVR